jgi:hypothetical protein
MEISRIVQEIQFVLAPAVMISSSALLLLGFQTKFSNLASRFRALNHEMRELAKIPQREPWQEKRHENLTHQTAHLFRRATHVKNAILCAYGAIILFLCTSVLLFLNIRSVISLSPWIVVTFMAGLLFELAAGVVMVIEVALAFEVIRIESRG